jgi:hypothetical protein
MGYLLGVAWLMLPGFAVEKQRGCIVEQSLRSRAIRTVPPVLN